jgi:hypothetical protein
VKKFSHTVFAVRGEDDLIAAFKTLGIHMEAIRQQMVGGEQVSEKFRWVLRSKGREVLCFRNTAQLEIFLAGLEFGGAQPQPGGPLPQTAKPVSDKFKSMINKPI